MKKRNKDGFTSGIKRAFENYRWFDYAFMLDIEYAIWKDWLNRYSKKCDKHDLESRDHRCVLVAKLAISLLDIIRGDKDILEQQDTDWKDLPNGQCSIFSTKLQLKKGYYVNMKNIRKVWPYIEDDMIKEPVWMSEWYKEKAWNLYNKLRTNYMRIMWD